MSGSRRCARRASSPNAMYADSDLLPQNPGQAVALLEEDAVFVRPPEARRSPCRPMPSTRRWRSRAPAPIPPPAAAAASSSTPARPSGSSTPPQVEAVRPNFDGIKVQLLTGGPLALFAQQLPAAAAINLLQGDYAPASGRAPGLQGLALRRDAAGRHCWRCTSAARSRSCAVLKKREHTVDASIRDVAASVGEATSSTCASTWRRGSPPRAAPAAGCCRRCRRSPRRAAQRRAPASRHSTSTAAARDDRRRTGCLEPGSPVQSLRENGWAADLGGGTNTADGYQGHLQVHANGT